MSQLTTSELNEIARRAMVENGFEPDFPSNVIVAVNHLKDNLPDFLKDSSVHDLRTLLWSSIDDASSRDLDQVEYVEELANGDIRVLVGIADVDEFVPKSSEIDVHAAKNTISIYAGSRIFPVLPEELSTDLTSLLNDVDRLSIVIEMVVAEDGMIRSNDIYRAVLHNYAKLSYEEIGDWLDENTATPHLFSKIEGLENQIRLQFKAASRLLELRQKNGALEFETIEASPVIKNGNVTDIKILHSNSARKIIENFMISANVAMAEFLEKHNAISLRRVVKTPARWDRIIEVANSFGVKLPETADSRALSAFLSARKIANPAQFPELSLSIIKLLRPGVVPCIHQDQEV